MTVAFSALQSIENFHGPGNDSEDSESQKTLGTPMMMQVSMVTTVIRPMSPGELADAMDFINRAKDSVKGLVKSGKDFYEKNKDTFEGIKRVITVVQGVADIVGGIKKFQPEKEDPMVKNLADLTKDVKALNEKLSEHFTEMKNLISQQTFFTQVMSPTMVLTMHMIDCIQNPGEDSKRNFRIAYKKMSAIQMQHNLNAHLERDTTNPLRLSISLEKVKTRATFEKWEDIYCRIMAQFMLLEAFADGLLELKSKTIFDRQRDASKKLLDNIQKWREEYENDGTYWNDMKKGIEFIIQMTSNPVIGRLSNSQLASSIKESLKKVLTRDSFYIFVFNEAKWQQDYTYICNNEKEQVTGVWNVKGYNAFIYRSRNAQKVTENEYYDMRKAVMGCDDKLHWPGALEGIIKTQLTDPQILPANGFIALIHDSLKPAVSHVFHNSSIPNTWNMGPGCYDWTVMDRDSHRRQYMLIASYP